MKIIIFGSTGMVGNYVYNYLTHVMPDHEVIGLSRNTGPFDARDRELKKHVIDLLDPGSVVINCVGVLKPHIQQVGAAETIMINSHWPMLLARACEKHSCDLIHICSDCVFTGHEGPYSESSVCDATDLYARTKAIAPSPATVIRTSVIGEEIRSTGVGLINWLRQALPETTVTGYDNCIWNGVTCLQLAKVIRDIITSGNFWSGVRHVFSPNPMTKDSLCRVINKVYNMNLNIRTVIASSISGSKVSSSGTIDRTLTTIYEPLKIPRIESQILEMKESKYHVSK